MSFVGRLLGVIFALLAICHAGFAAPREELIARMEAIRASIGEEQNAANDAQRSYEATNAELKKIKLEVTKIKSEEQTLVANLTKLEKTQTSSERERVAMLEEQTQIKARLMARIRAVYLVPRSSVLATLVSGTGQVGFGVINRYLESVYKHDTELANRLRAVTEKIEAKNSSLQALLIKQRSLTKDIKARREALATRFAAQERITAAARVEQSRREQAVAALRAKLLRFESTLAGLTGGSYEVTEGDSTSVSQLAESFDGPGLKKKKSVPMPVTGAVVTRFGGTRKDGQPSKGLEIAAVGLAAVKAIATGRVVFVGELPGLGSVVVIDHGQRSFSLYGRLAHPTCSVGAVMEGLSVIGEASGDQPIYFEIRQSGVAVDPRGFVA